MFEFLSTLRLKLNALRHRRQLDRDLEDELAFHLAMRAEKLREAGDASDPRRGFGNDTQIRESTRELWTFDSLETLVADVRYTLRILWRSPVFTLVAIASLAIGIGANTAIFSLLDAVLMRSLPVRDPQQLRLILWTGDPKAPLKSRSGYNTRLHGVDASSSFSWSMYGQFAALPQFSNVIGFAHSESTVIARGDSHYAAALFATGDLFSTLGVNPAVGRVFGPEDDRPGAPATAVISYNYWQRRWGLDPAAVGSTITVNSKPVIIAGVSEAGFHGLEPGRDYDLLFPMSLVADFGPKFYDLTDPGIWFVQILGRLRPNVSDAELRSALTAVMRSAETAPAKPGERKQPWTPLVEPGAGGVALMRYHAETPLLILAGVVLLVLLIACTNLASLLMARGTARRRELAIRLSIGASRFRLVRQLLTESLILSLAGALTGLAIAPALANTAMSMAAAGERVSLDIQLDSRVLLFTAAVTVLTALLFGIIPALRSTRIDLSPSLKDGAAGATGSSPARLGRILLSGQVALSMILLTGAALFVRTLDNLNRIQPGFNTQHLIIFTLDGTRSGYKGDRLTALYNRVNTDLGHLPGVQSVTFSSSPLIADNIDNSDVTIVGAPSAKLRMANQMAVGPGFFRAMGIPILLGRDLHESDGPGAPRVAIVNQTFARAYLAGQSPLGHEFYFGSTAQEALDRMQIIAICGDAKYDSLKRDVQPTVYMPAVQNPKWIAAATFEVRSQASPAALAGAIRETVAHIDRGVPVAGLRTQEEQIRLSLGLERMFAILVGSFGLLAALLAAIGLYGLMAYSVQRRMPEIGVRLALGAPPAGIRSMILRDSLSLVAIGLAIGIPAAFLATRVLRSALFGVAPSDPASFAAAGLLMLLVALAAAWYPARRASKVDAIQVLKYE